MNCCEDHIEIVLDMYVDSHELAPELNLLESVKQTECCEFCEKKAVYKVGN